MYRPAARTILRSSQGSLAPARTLASRRFISTEPPHLRGRSWKSSALRWGIAVAGIYYYNTSPVFAEQPQNNLLNPNLDAVDEATSPSLDVLAARRKNKNAQALHSAADALSSENASTSASNQPITTDTAPAPGSTQELEEEAAGEGAFNPETGEINWDCPCLGGMAHGPCGPEFREAFSCFVFSTEEPKGMDCIEKFQGMRDCFQKHPDVYKDELMDDEEIDAELENEQHELTQQIAERRKQDLATEGTGQRRLLEETAPEPRVKATRKTEQQPESSKSRPIDTPESATTRNQERGERKKPASSTEEKESIHDSQKSQMVKQAYPPPPTGAEHAMDALVPKAAHDARDVKA